VRQAGRQGREGRLQGSGLPEKHGLDLVGRRVLARKVPLALLALLARKVPLALLALLAPLALLALLAPLAPLARRVTRGSRWPRWSEG